MLLLLLLLLLLLRAAFEAMLAARHAPWLQWQSSCCLSGFPIVVCRDERMVRNPSCREEQASLELDASVVIHMRYGPTDTSSVRVK
jgi:hypothetical protein